MKSFSEIIELIKEIESLKFDLDVANILKVPRNKLAIWKMRNTIPLDVLIRYCEERDYYLDFILTGTGLLYKSASMVKDKSPEYLIQRNNELEKENAKLRNIVKKIEDDISEVNYGVTPDDGVVPDTP